MLYLNRLTTSLLIAFGLLVLSFASCSKTTAPTPQTGDVVFEGGYDTDPRDNGRPVALIAAALNVPSQVFRDAFSGVTPAHGRGPTHAEAQANKKVLMDALEKHGVTNDRLDEVSNFYRYRPQNGELWTHTPAKAKAEIRDGKVISIQIIDEGSGYLSPPSASIKGFEDVELIVEIDFNTRLETNGRIKAIKIKQ